MEHGAILHTQWIVFQYEAIFKHVMLAELAVSAAHVNYFKKFSIL